MRILSSIIILVLLSACGKGGGGAAANSPAPTVPVDHTPHDYVAYIFSPDSSASSATIHQVCNFGESTGFRDETVSVSVGGATPTAGAGCAGVVNYTAEVTALTGTVYFEVSIDGVWHPELERVISTGGTYTFQRGF